MRSSTIDEKLYNLFLLRMIKDGPLALSSRRIWQNRSTELLALLVTDSFNAGHLDRHVKMENGYVQSEWWTLSQDGVRLVNSLMSVHGNYYEVDSRLIEMGLQ